MVASFSEEAATKIFGVHAVFYRRIISVES